jgi:hypothetical protein
MNILTHPHRAASASSSMTLLGRRLSTLVHGEARGIRLGAGAAAGIAGGLVGGWGSPALSGCAGLLFGWPAVAGCALAQLLTVWALRGDLLAALVSALASAILGASGYLVFRTVPEIGRGLPNLRSHLWLLGSAALGGLVGGLLFALAGQGPRGFWTWAAASLVGALLLSPPILLTADRFLRRWMLAIPGELPARRTRRLGLTPDVVEAVGAETVMVAAPRRQNLGRDIWIVAGLVLAVTAVAVPVGGLLPESGPWSVLLYLVPILWASLSYGLRGGVLTASASGLAWLLGLAGMAVMTGEPGADSWLQSGHFLVLSLVGAFVGASREQEAHLREELMDANRLLRRDLLHVVQALTQAVEAKDSYTEGHLHRVSEYAVALGARLGLRGHDLEMLHYASMLHDIGKIGIPEEILRKEGPLDQVQAEIMQRHPDIGARILERLDLLRGAAPIVRHHQERYDGRMDGTYPGYPGGLSGESIPIGARIVSVVDAFDAMTTDRPYRRALSIEQATSVLRKERGRQFDPVVVDTFLLLLTERPWRRLV